MHQNAIVFVTYGEFCLDFVESLFFSVSVLCHIFNIWNAQVFFFSWFFMCCQTKLFVIDMHSYTADTNPFDLNLNPWMRTIGVDVSLEFYFFIPLSHRQHYITIIYWVLWRVSSNENERRQHREVKKKKNKQTQ